MSAVLLSSRFKVIFAQYSAAPELGARAALAARWLPEERKIELRFIAAGKDATRVELEHQHDEMRAIFDKEGDSGQFSCHVRPPQRKENTPGGVLLTLNFHRPSTGLD